MTETTNIKDFWNNRDLYRSLNAEELSNTVIKIYTEDFINNYNTWIKNLKNLNEISFNNISESFSDVSWWVDMSFDYFCKNILENIKKLIFETNTIESTDILNIVQKLINDYIYSLIGEYNEKINKLNTNDKKPDLFSSIVKTKFIYG